MIVGRVREIWRYPVKSMAGERLDASEVGPQGLPGDRGWAVRDEVRGGIRGAKQIPALMQCGARTLEAAAAGRSLPAEVTLPDGSRLRTGDADAAERLSRALGRAVTLWPLLPADALDHYRRGAPSHPDFEAELRAIFGREPDEPLPDLSVFPPEILEFESPPGTYFDAFPLLLLSVPSIDAVQAAAPGSRIDVRRFRPNLLLESDVADAFPEHAWRGARLRVGGAVLAGATPCPRCVMVTHPQGELPKDPRIMRTLVRETGGNLGLYATVAEAGPVALGDTVELLGE